MRSETCLRISFHRASLSAPSRSSISWRRSEIPGKAEAPYKLNFPGAKMAFRDSGRPGSPILFNKNQNQQETFLLDHSLWKFSNIESKVS